MLLFCLTLFAAAEAKDSSAGKKEIVIMTYNVRNCRGLDNNTDYDRVAEVIRKANPDFVALQELDSATTRSNGIIVLNELGSRLKMNQAYGPSIAYQGGKYGIGILTKEKQIARKFIPLPGSEEKRGLLIVETKSLIICCSHFSLTAADRIKSVEIINTLFSKTKKPVILAGDLNATPDSEEMKALSASWITLNNPETPTIPADNPRKCIDYIMLLKNSYSEYKILDRVVGKEPVASDHLPVWVRLTMKR